MMDVKEQVDLYFPDSMNPLLLYLPAVTLGLATLLPGCDCMIGLPGAEISYAAFSALYVLAVSFLIQNLGLRHGHEDLASRITGRFFQEKEGRYEGLAVGVTAVFVASIYITTTLFLYSFMTSTTSLLVMEQAIYLFVYVLQLVTIFEFSIYNILENL